MMNVSASTAPQLQIDGFTFEELFQPSSLEQLDQRFLTFLKEQDSSLHDHLLAYRLKLHTFTPEETSTLLIASARLLEPFIAQLFYIEPAVRIAQLKVLANDPIFLFKQWYVLREAKRKLNKSQEYPDFNSLTEWVKAALQDEGIDFQNDFELAVAQLGELFLKEEPHYLEPREKLVIWCVQAMTQAEGQQFTDGWVAFHLPNKVDYDYLVPMVTVPNDELQRFAAKDESLRQRDGFKLTDLRMTQREVLGEVHYCVYCHKNDGDFCSKGFPVKKTEPELGLKTNPLGETLTGCPLEEKISEMHVLKRDGFNIAALAMVMVDNPMCPITGHRICNDCMKACIYQKQDPVNIPQTETGILTDVLHLPWGVEIYDLFTRWNPLRSEQWVAKPYNGLKALVMGLGPAGITLAHYLTMEGFAVVGADGLKIEPLPQYYVQQPIFSYEDLKEDLDARILAGFGGVAEYGITVRWDKNFLKLIYISLMRRPHFQVFGGVRFGGTVTLDDAWKLGFDHVAIAVGAGLPKELNIPDSLAPGMRQANDFLMALQLTGAAKKSSLANLQVRLPALVIGGGLTGIDTATEIQAYYLAQVEKTLERYEKLCAYFGEAETDKHFIGQSGHVLAEFLEHGRAVRIERELASQEGRKPDFITLLRSWGGVTVVYRRKLQESPAYTRNHEEVTKAIEEGIYYAEDLEPIAARLDDYGHVAGLVCKHASGEKILPARSILVATGAKPNIAYEFEHRGTFHREGPVYQTYLEREGELEVIFADGHCKVEEFGPFTSYQENGHRVSFLGDTHPVFHGSVVKAIASAKRTYPHILASLGDRAYAIGSKQEYQQFATTMQNLFNAKILKVRRLSENIIELMVHAPMAAKNFYPGQFYRVQNFETHAAFAGHTRLFAEGIALIGTDVDKDQGNLSFMVVEKGASTRMFATFKENDPVFIMGPTGARSKIPQDQETVLVIGGQMAGAHLRAIGPAMRAAGNKVIFVGIYESDSEVHHQTAIESATDAVLWLTKSGQCVSSNRQQDIAVTGEIIEQLLAQKDKLGLLGVDRVHIVGTHRLVKLLQSARKQELKDCFSKDALFLASIYGPMQCMLKGVCAQCLQWQIDPKTGLRTKAVFACSWQEQPVDIVDLHNLDERLEQNHMQEILSNLWLDYLFLSQDITKV